MLIATDLSGTDLPPFRRDSYVVRRVSEYDRLRFD
jgi:hypothetical protein